MAVSQVIKSEKQILHGYGAIFHSQRDIVIGIIQSLKWTLEEKGSEPEETIRNLLCFLAPLGEVEFSLQDAPPEIGENETISGIGTLYYLTEDTSLLENLRDGGLWDLFDYLRRLRALVGLYLLEGRIKFPYINQRLKAIEKWLVPFINIDTGRIWIDGFRVIDEKARKLIDPFSQVSVSDYGLTYREAICHLEKHLHRKLTSDFVESLLNIISQIPVGFSAGKPLAQCIESSKAKPKKTPKKREIKRWSRDTVIERFDITENAPRIKSDMSIYRRENGMLYIRIRIDGNPRPKRLSLGTRDMTEALWKARSVIEAALEEKETKGIPTFSEFTNDDYRTFSKHNHKRSTHKRRFERIGRLLKELGHLKLNRLDKKTIATYKRDRSKEVAPRTVNKELDIISSILEYAKELEYIDNNPAREVKKMRQPPGKDYALTRDELKRLIEACKELSKRDGTRNPILPEIVIVAARVGLRKGNMMSLKWNQVDLEKWRITIPAQEHKNRRPHRPPILFPEAKRALLNLKERYPDAVYVFCKPDGSAYGDWNRSFKNACKMVGLGHVRFQDLRHTFRTTLGELGVPDEISHKLMGHRTATASYGYLSMSDKLIRRLTEDVENNPEGLY